MAYVDKAERTKLQQRLNRVIGQLQGLQKRLAEGSTDCLSDVQQIKAAHNALWKVAQTYVEIYLSECMKQNKSNAEIERNMQSVIKASFSL